MQSIPVSICYAFLLLSLAIHDVPMAQAVFAIVLSIADPFGPQDWYPLMYLLILEGIMLFQDQDSTELPEIILWGVDGRAILAEDEGMDMANGQGDENDDGKDGDAGRGFLGGEFEDKLCAA
ncbi:uncharacterized protein L3040_006813 [Drepanopeziza brunnea f. sp. 'multigermtubi']|nr:hypothetical protein L3040_006813 [Drepanopeziza brunnea f. sp. 'multigermtubi']